jgi:hypothetical protein
MLERQLEEWCAYPMWVQRCVQVLITDDCSAQHPLRNVLNNVNGLSIRAFRLTRKVPWNWLACRNIGAYHARGYWLLLTDIDHVLTRENAVRLLNTLPDLNSNIVYTFTRVDHINNPVKPHGNSYLMTRGMYWRVGGYNEHYSGNYWGTSGTFRQQVLRITSIKQLDIPLTLFTCGEIADAESGLPKCGRAVYNGEIKTLTFPYETA